MVALYHNYTKISRESAFKRNTPQSISNLPGEQSRTRAVSPGNVSLSRGWERHTSTNAPLPWQASPLEMLIGQRTWNEPALSSACLNVQATRSVQPTVRVHYQPGKALLDLRPRRRFPRPAGL